MLNGALAFLNMLFEFLDFFWLQDFFGWIDKNKIYSARRSSKAAESVLNTVQNANDISVFDSTLQQDRQGHKDI